MLSNSRWNSILQWLRSYSGIIWAAERLKVINVAWKFFCVANCLVRKFTQSSLMEIAYWQALRTLPYKRLLMTINHEIKRISLTRCACQAVKYHSMLNAVILSLLSVFLSVNCHFFLNITMTKITGQLTARADNNWPSSTWADKRPIRLHKWFVV